jgi:hypothetical protein
LCAYLDELYVANVMQAVFREYGRGVGWMRTVIVDLAIPVDVCLPDHLVDFLVRKLLACTPRSSTK